MDKEFKHIKSSGFKVPKGYFESLDERLLDLTKTGSPLSSIPNTGFKAPEGYFENFRIKPKKAKVITLKRVLYISGVAAVLALLITVFVPKNTLSFDSLETATIETYLLEESYQPSDIASLLNENELTLESFNLVPDEEQLEDYVIQNSSIENLLDL